MVGPLAYIGGKNRLAVKIISLLPEQTTRRPRMRCGP
jgi:site-specific DNA-adenine methylase